MISSGVCRLRFMLRVRRRGRAANSHSAWINFRGAGQLFIGQAQAGQRSAIIYTVIECCHRRGLDPFAYLRDVFTRLPSMTNWQVNDLTPEAWAKNRKRVDRRAA